jgi:hypothetical protein
MSAWEREFCGAVEVALAERLSGRLEPGERVRVWGESGEDVRATLILEGGGSGDRLVLEVRVPVAGKSDLARDVALDALDLLLLEHLESGRDLHYPGVWEGRELCGRALQVRAERTFPELDARADALLEEGRRGS